MNPQQNNQTPLDYLNQIAPQAPKRGGLNSKPILFILAGLAAVIIVIIVSITVTSMASSRKDPWAQFAVKLNSTEAIVNDSSSKLKSNQLRTTNSALRLYITNTRRDVTPIITTVGVDVKKLPAKMVAAETNNGMTERLETGRLNAKYDSTYAREMSYQTAALLALLKQMYSQSSTQATKDTLSTAYDSLEATNKALSEFSALNE